MNTILIADDQKLFADMLCKILETYADFQVVACAENGEDAYRCYQSLTPSLCLLDIQMPQTGGLYALRRIKSAFPAAKVIMLTTFSNDEQILEAYCNDADGYLLKDMLPDALCDAMRAVLSGQCVIHKDIQRFLIDQLKKVRTEAGSFPISDQCCGEAFSPRDISIIRLIAEGQSNREIANALNYSEGTVRNRISAILADTGHHDRTQLALFAIKNGLV